MAQQKKSKRKSGGPFLAAAVFCESIMEDANKMVSAIKILDGCTLVIAPDAPKEVPSKESPLSLIQNMLLIFRTGDAPGKHHLKVVGEQPDGKRRVVSEQTIEFGKEPQGGPVLKTTVNMTIFSGGVFWMDIILDGKRLTRMPLNIAIHRFELPTAQAKNAVKRR